LTVVATLKDGRMIVKAVISSVTTGAAGSVATTATFPDLKKLEYVLQYNFDTSPATYAVPYNQKIDRNIVGVTVYVGAGTTLSGEAIGVGF
jgi:hypothetical protein